MRGENQAQGMAVVRPDIDAIAVTSPGYCHEEHAVAALEAAERTGRVFRSAT